MRLVKLVFVLGFLANLGLPGGMAGAAVATSGQPPAAAAQGIREKLFSAQMALSADPPAAREYLAGAREIYARELAQALEAVSPGAGISIRDGLAAAAAALEEGDAPSFAAARARVWTAILAGGVSAVESALQEGEGALASRWLALREYRTTTRFSRPGVEATLAVERFNRGELGPDEALLAVQADLYDTYQARLTEALHDLSTEASEYPARRVELAALAEGYFALLAPAYESQRGAAQTQAAADAFVNLSRAALEGGELEAALQAVDAALHNFRAAPLSPAEQARRAVQLLRYLNLVPVEYGRGVKEGRVLHDFEVQEAITFHAAAFAAFADLESSLEAQAPGQAIELKRRFETLGQILSRAGKGEAVERSEAVEAQAGELADLLEQAMPAAWLETGSQGDYDLVTALLDQMEAAIASKDYAAAESARIEAYAVLETGPEARLKAFAPELALQIEDLFWNSQEPHPGLAHLIQSQATPDKIRATRARLDASLSESQAVLGGNTAPAAVAANAGVIVFREGLEAVIILASLMSSMKRKEERRHRRPMWLGAAAALAATALTWALAHDVLQSLARYGEKLEAVISLAALAVLLLIMNWFFHKHYWTEWIAGFHARKRRIISGEAGLWLGLVTLGFTSVYREGFETVLFLQALVLDSRPVVVLAGVAGALLAVLAVGLVTFRMQVNLPYKKMLVITGVLIGAVLLQMVGTTVHLLQVVGWMPVHVISGLPLPYWLGAWFGVYATWEGLAWQVLAGAFVIGSYFLAERIRPNRPASGAQQLKA